MIVDAFNQLIATRNFEQISVKDITAIATVNRATFYAHFVDKYELLDEMLTENIRGVMKEHFTCNPDLNEDSIVQMFISITEIHDRMHTQCKRGYNTFTQRIEDKVKEQLTLLVSHSLQSNNQLLAAMFGWALYSAFVQWDHSRQEPIQTFAKTAAPLLLRLLN
ncbi:DNA-binding transcriptional repressor FabR [compost metagenome]